MPSRVRIRPLAMEDEAAFLAAVRQSRALHGPWVQPPSTPEKFAAYVERLGSPANHGYAVEVRATSELAGVVMITNIVLGFFRSGYLAYYAFEGFQGQGYMKEGLKAVVRQAFAGLKLHRLEANIQPENTASIALVKSCGFRKEGYSPRYLKIRGRWRDHERWAILAR